MNATCVDLNGNGNGNIDFSGVDRLTQTDTDYGNFTVGGSTVTAKYDAITSRDNCRSSRISANR